MARGLAAVVLLGLVLAVVAGVVAHGRGDNTARPVPRRPAALAPPDYAKAVAANYELLSPRQSERLLGFTRDPRSCLVRRGLAVGRPKPSATRIELPLPADARPHAVARASLACGSALGGPPPGASVQLPPDGKAILVYLPKYCLLDPKVARAG